MTTPTGDGPSLERWELVLGALDAVTPAIGRPLTSARVAVAASHDVRSGFAWEWDQVNLTPEAWEAGLHDVRLVVVEVDGDAVRGWPESPAAVEIAEAARGRGITAVAWITGSTAPSDAGDRIVAAFDVVCVADTDDAAAWRERWSDHRIDTLLPATQPRAQTPARSHREVERNGEVLVLTDQSAVDAPDDLVSAVRPARPTRSSLSVDVWQRGTSAYGTELTHVAAQYLVHADVGRRLPADTWPVLNSLAARAAVVTTPARVENLPPDLRDAVAVAGRDTIRRHVDVLARQPELRDRETHVGHRAVLDGHTFADRARTLLGVAGIQVPPQNRTVSVVVPTNRPHELPNVLENVARQVRVSTELVIVGHGIDIDRADITDRAKDLGLDQLTILDAGATLTLGAVMNLGLDAASGEYVAKMDDDNFYGADYLGDLLDIFNYTDAGIVGKWAHYVWLRSSGAVVLRFERYEHTYHRLVQGGSILAHRDVARDLWFSDIPRAVDSDFLNRAMAAGVRTYSGDRFNFVSVRGDDRLSHTWKIDDLVLMAGAGRVVTYGDPRELVSV